MEKEMMIAGFVVSSLFFVVIGWLLLIKRKDKITDLFISATAVTVAMVFTIGFYFTTTRLTNERRKQELAELLDVELSHAYGLVNSSDTLEVRFEKSGESYKPIFGNLTTIILEESLKSGLFDKKCTEKMLILTKNIYLYNKSVDYFLTILASDNKSLKEQVSHATKTINHLCDVIDENIKSLSFQLQYKKYRRKSRVNYLTVIAVVLGTVVIIYTLYWFVKFVIWAIKTLKRKEE